MLSKTIDELRQIPITAWGFTDPGSHADGDGSFKRILLAAADSKAGMRALAATAGLARGNGSDVCVVHLIERVFLGRAGWCSIETADEANQLLGRFRAELETRGVRVTARSGKARREQLAIHILLAAAEFRADVIVIGTRRISPLWAALSGSVSHEIIRRSRIPVIAVP